MSMQRRSFLKKAGLGLAATAAAAPAIAQTSGGPTVTWRLASSFPKSLDTLWGGAETIAKRVSAATGGRFTIRASAAGELVPPFATVDAVQNGTIECTHTAGYYFLGKDMTFAFCTGLPFGMNTRQHNAWLYHGGGIDLLRDFLKEYNIINFPAGNTGAQMGGWFRKEIKTVADLKGLKMRIGGTGGPPLARLGVAPQTIPGGEIYSSLEKGAIDAAEWVGPYDDEKLGFYKVAKYYYYPGWWEGGTGIDLYVNTKAWESLPADYKAILEAACAETTVDMMAKYDAVNPAGLKKLVANGTQLRAFSPEIMAACYRASQEAYSEIAKSNAKFKKIYDSYNAFLRDEVDWFKVAENRMDNFMITAQRIQTSGSAAKAAPAAKAAAPAAKGAK
jgi:TRAP-type mannitol/chloroaromatic compound transport system substrate-binding protein